jgi:antitoxin component YwqK of YwqJK toxin-antitoxin module
MHSIIHSNRIQPTDKMMRIPRLPRTLLILFAVLMLFGVSGSVMGETIENLVLRDGLYFKKFSDVPFTGKVVEEGEKGSIRDGKKEGPWVSYFDTGQLSTKGNYKNGEREGPWVSYHNNGQLFYKFNYKNGKVNGHGVTYHIGGKLLDEGNYKNGEREGPHVSYDAFGYGVLTEKGNYNNDKKEGAWIYFNCNIFDVGKFGGDCPRKKVTIFYKNGERIR